MTPADLIANTIIQCGECTACCRNTMVILRDDETGYADTIVRVASGDQYRILQSRPNGDCVYLTNHGCSIHDHKPAMCREYDCREVYMAMIVAKTRRERRADIASCGDLKAVLRAGRKQLRNTTKVGMKGA